MSEKDETSGEKSPILPKYYKADMNEEAVSIKRKKSSAKTSSSCACRIVVLLAILIVVSALIGLGVGLGVHYGQKSSSSTTSLANTIKRNDLKELLLNLQNTKVNDSRSVLTGYNNSAEYVNETLKDNGYNVTRQYFNVPVPEDNEGTFKVMSTVGGEMLEFEYPQYNQFAIMIYSAGCSSDCTWELASLIDDEESDFGCDEITVDDVEGKAVLIPYTAGNCSVYEKAYFAKKAGATAIIFVSGNPSSTTPPRTRVFEREDNGTVSYVDIPSVGVTNATGNQLLQLFNIAPTTTRVTLELSASVTIGYTYNVFAETDGGRADRVIVFGSHLDSVPAGPGINDDGSGSMTNLQVAIQVAKLRLEPKNKVRFAWWGAEELGLLGSRYYVASLSENDKNDISLYLNFDMVGSPNFVRGVYSAESAENNDLLGPLTRIQNLFIEYFNNTNANYSLEDFTGGSDYRPFLDADIPAGGLFTGAGGIKTEDEWKLFGGLRNVAHDPCYHQSCDTTDNINYDVYEEMSRAAAYTLQTLMEQEDLKQYLEGQN